MRLHKGLAPAANLIKTAGDNQKGPYAKSGCDGKNAPNDQCKPDREIKVFVSNCRCSPEDRERIIKAILREFRI